MITSRLYRVILGFTILSFYCVLPAYGDLETMKVGETRMITCYPVHDWFEASWDSSDPSSVKITWSAGTTVQVQALKPTKSIDDIVTLTCRYRYTVDRGDYWIDRTGYEYVSVFVEGIPPTAVSLPTFKTIHLGETLTLTPVLTPNDAYATFTWRSSDESIATVSSSGVVTPKSFGKTTITVTTDNNLSATCVVTVEKIDATGVSIQNPGSIAVGDTKVLKHILTPSNANSTVTWKSDNTSIATITSTGYLRAYKKGTVNITVTTDNGLSATRQIRIYPAPEKVSLPNEYSLGLRHTVKLAPTLYPTDAYTTFVWTSDNWEVAEVNEEGVVKALSLGTATITATSKNGLSATCTINVPYPTPQLLVWMRNGECVTFGFEEKPRLSFTTDNVSIFTQSSAVEYRNNEIQKYLIVDTAVKNENSSVTPFIESGDVLKVKQGMVMISGGVPRSRVWIYSISGNKVSEYLMDYTGCVIFSTNTYPQGGYIIKTDKTTFKFYKQ